MGYVIFQHFFFDAPQCGTNCGDLRYDIDAIAIFIHHLGETADLAVCTENLDVTESPKLPE